MLEQEEKNEPIQKRFEDAEVVAAMLGLKKPALYEAVRKGIIPATHIGRRLRFDMNVLLDWAAKGGTKL